MKHVLILGGGFGGVECYRRLHKYTHNKNISITLVNRENYSLFTPMLHEVATGSVTRNHIVQPLREIISCCHNRFIQATVKGIDIERKCVQTDVAVLKYDYLVIALGCAVNYRGVEGALEHAFGFKGMGDAVLLRNHILEQFERAAWADNAERDERLNFVVIAGGLTGVELSAQIADLFKDVRKLYADVPKCTPKVTLVHSRDRVIPALSPISSKRALKALKKKGVDVRLGLRASEVDERFVKFNDGSKIATRSVIWTTGIRSTLSEVLPKEVLTDKGWLPVGNDLRMIDFPEVFAVGDVVSIVDEGVDNPPATAQAATQEGRLVADNILSSIKGNTLKSYEFKSKGELVPIGDWYGVAEIGSIKFGGRLAWWMRRTIFIQRLWSWTNRLKVTFDWTVNSFRPRDTSQL